MEGITFAFGMIWGIVVYHFSRKKPPRGTIGDKNMPIGAELAQKGWAVVVNATGKNRVRLGTFINSSLPNHPCELEVRIMAASSILSEIRDEHPDSDICDEVAALMVHLGTYCRDADKEDK